MRFRFFWIILSVVSLVVIGTTILHGEFLRREKIELIDEQVRSTAAALLDTEIGAIRRPKFRRIEAILSEELGENQFGKFFVIRNSLGNVLFESAGVKVLPVKDFPTSPLWITYIEKGQYIRILNLNLPSFDDRILQVGVSIDQDILAPTYFSKANMTFTAAIVGVALLVAWFLSALLVRPIARLSGFISHAAHNPNTNMELPALPQELKKLVSGARSKDELAELLSGFDTLIERVNRDYRVSRFWSYQMAHELKTPMALIDAKVTEAQRQGTVKGSVGDEILSEVFEVSETITSFLTWAEVENAPAAQKRLFVVRAAKIAHGLKDRLETSFPGRLKIQTEGDFNVMTNIQHLEQAVGNLMVNALTYSPSEKPVCVTVKNSSVEIVDQGPGIPPTVMERLGDPFNKGENSPVGRKGSGLGLALVQSICRLYDWKVSFHTSAGGTKVTLQFPGVDHEQNPAV